MMNAEERFDDYVNQLEQADVKDIGFIMMGIAWRPSGDPRMLAYLEGYLEDTRPTVIFLKPDRYTEVRYAAGRALATERGVQGITEWVPVPFSVIPLTWTEMGHLAREAGLNSNLDPLELLPILMEKKLVPRRNHGFPARIPPGWLNKDDKQD